MSIRLKSPGAGGAGGLLVYSTVAAAESAIGVDNDLVYVVEIESIYRYEDAAGAYVRDGTFVLDTGDGGTTRWLAVAGRYIFAELNVTGVVTANDKLTVAGLIDPTGLILVEQATVPGGTPSSGDGAIWVRTDGIPMFTDDSGVDHVLLGGAGSIITQNNSVLVDALASTINFNNGVVATGGAGLTTINIDYGASAVDVGSTGSAGVAASLSRSDHVHRGLHSLTDSVAATPLYGDVTVTGGANVTLVQVGQDISIAAVGGVDTKEDGVVVDSPAAVIDFNNGIVATGGAGTTTVNIDYHGSVSDVGSSSIPGVGVSPSRVDHAHRGLHSLTDSVTATPLYGDATITGGTNVTLSQVGQDISIASLDTIGVGTQEDGTPVDTPASVINFNNGVVATGGAGTTAINIDYGSSAAEVASAGAAGSATSLSRSDHAHRGLHSLTDSVTATPLYGDVTLTAGTDVALVQVGQDITINGTGDYVVGPASATDDALAVYDGVTGDLLKDGIVPIEQYVSVPAGPTSSGIKGQRAYGANYIYECIATDTWVRHAVITTW